MQNQNPGREDGTGSGDDVTSVRSDVMRNQLTVYILMSKDTFYLLFYPARLKVWTGSGPRLEWFCRPVAACPEMVQTRKNGPHQNLLSAFLLGYFGPYEGRF